MPKSRPLLGTTLVRCLGPGKDHFFKSRDKTRNRICESCEKKIREVSVMARGPIVPERD